MKINSVVARQLLDCKARPLVEVDITTDTGHIGRGASPTGTSIGMHEAFVLRDRDRAEYNGLSVHRAVAAGVSFHLCKSGVVHHRTAVGADRRSVL